MTVELGTVLHRSSVLAESLDGALEAFTFGDCRCIYMIADRKDVCLDLLRNLVLACVLKTELS